MKRSLLSALLTGVTDLVLPRVCVVCDRLNPRRAGLVCASCWNEVPWLPRPRCERCGHPASGGACLWCPQLPDVVRWCRSACWVPEGAGGVIVHRLKYDGWTALAAEVAERLARAAPAPSEPGASVVVPVPLGRRRRRERGYNQSALIADALGNLWRVPVVASAVERVRETTSQVRLTPDERSANVHAAFAAGAGADAIRGRHVVLVDDVVTTAATLNACAAAVVAAGALTLSYVTFGRARAAFDRGRHPRSDSRWQSVSASTASAASGGRSFALPRSAESPISTSSRSTT